MSVFSGDFLGFTLGQIHSSQLNITRVSSGDRYEDNLLPSLKETFVENPGGDGVYYFNTQYQQKPFTLNFAYDDLRDEDLRALRQTFGFKGVQPLIFDELPYKKYMVKCSAPPIFKYICFDYQDMRLYKGEGQVNLVAYYPFAFATFSPTIKNNGIGLINNVGDLPAQLQIIYDIENVSNLTKIQLFDLENNVIGELNFKDFVKQGEDSYISINSKTHLIEGLDKDFERTGNLYNKYITTGDFFDAPIGRTEFQSSTQFNTLKYTPLYY